MSTHVARTEHRAAGRASKDGARPLPRGAERLLALPPERFAAERDALAKRLAADGDTAGAAEVRRLRRPIGLAWLLNRVAQERPREVEELLSAGDRVRAAQRRAIAGGGGEELRSADEGIRRIARTLRGSARELSTEAGREPAAAALARLELLLRVVSGAPGEVRETLRRGVLRREPEVVSGDLSGLALVAPAPGSERPPAGKGEASGRTREAGRGTRAASPRETEARARREAAARAKVERAERLRAERAARERRRRRAGAERSLAAAERAAEKARRAAEAAERRVEAARVHLRALDGESPR